MEARLKALRDELMESSTASSDDAKPVELDQQKVGRLSRMDAMQVQAMSAETGRRRNVQLERVSSALERIKTNNYGECVKCGEDIAEQRLEADPAAPLCLQCADQSERRG